MGASPSQGKNYHNCNKNKGVEDNIDSTSAHQEGYYCQTQTHAEKLVKVPLQDMRGFHKFIGALTYQTIDGRRGQGTAILISRNLILTAAHNICWKSKTHTINKNFRFYLAPCGITQKYYQIKPGNWRYSQQYETCNNEINYKYDYALMKLNSVQSNDDFVPIPLCMNCYQCEQSKHLEAKLSIFGYPIAGDIPNYRPDYHSESKIELYQYGLTKTGRVKQSKKLQQICYAISTLPGQSGSPIICEGQVIGLHIKGFVDGKSKDPYNVGRLITPDIIDNLERWRQDLNGYPFSIKAKYGCIHMPRVICRVWDTFQEQVQGQYLSQAYASNSILESQGTSRRKSINLPQILSSIQSQIMREKIYLNRLSLDIIDIRRFIILKQLSLVHNNIAQIDLTNNEFLTKLWLSKNRLQNIDLTKNQKLIHLGLSENRLETIDLSQNTSLVQIYLKDNHLVNLDLSNNMQAERVDVSYNYLNNLIICFSKRLFLDNQSQRSNQCETKFLFAQGEEFECRKFVDDQIQQLSNNKQKTNRYDCSYSYKVDRID